MTKGSMNPNSLSNSLFADIREHIMNGKYSNGEKLTENKICSEFGVSRTPVREAFKQLELEGLIENIPNRGAFVIGLSEQDIHDIYELRKAIEIKAIKWAIERMAEEELKDLQESYDLMEFYTLKKDTEKVEDMNSNFHEIIYQSTHSRFLEHVLKSYQFYIMKTRRAALQVEDRLEEVLQEHKRILDAIYAKDIEEGKKAVIEHLTNSQRRTQIGLNSFQTNK